MAMEFKVLKAEYEGLNFQIEEDFPEVGAYLYVYRNDVCFKDYLQNSVNACKEIAFEEFGVPLEKWGE
jgi:hypothetical protein